MSEAKKKQELGGWEVENSCFIDACISLSRLFLKLLKKIIIKLFHGVCFPRYFFFFLRESFVRVDFLLLFLRMLLLQVFRMDEDARFFSRVLLLCE